MRFTIVSFVCLILLLIARLHAADIPPISTNLVAPIELTDQFDHVQKISFPATNFILLAIADRKSQKIMDDWMALIAPRYDRQLAIHGIADLGALPGILHGIAINRLRANQPHPVMLDWTGAVGDRFGYQSGQPCLVLINPTGYIRGRFIGPPVKTNYTAAFKLIDHELSLQKTNLATNSSPTNSPNPAAPLP